MSDKEAGPQRGCPAPVRATGELTPERWQEIKQLVLAAQEKDAAAREEFLQEACGSDHDLRTEVDSLLAGDDNQFESGLSTVGLLDAAGLVSVAHPIVGRRLGAYEIVRQIGRGGMATVYLAARADDAYHKHVAVS